jgi:hypothetical protein
MAVRAKIQQSLNKLPSAQKFICPFAEEIWMIEMASSMKLSKSFKALKALTELKERCPQQRIGQILWNAMGKAGRWTAPEANSLFFIEDEELAKILMAYSSKKRQ